MPEQLQFENGFTVRRTADHMVLQLWDPHGDLVATSPCEEAPLEAMAKPFMYGYFAGWRNCKHTLHVQLDTAFAGTDIV